MSYNKGRKFFCAALAAILSLTMNCGVLAAAEDEAGAVTFSEEVTVSEETPITPAEDNLADNNVTDTTADDSTENNISDSENGGTEDGYNITDAPADDSTDNNVTDGESDDPNVPVVLAETDEVLIDETTFPDAGFRQWVLDNVDTDQSGSLSQEEINSVTKISFSSGIKISDLTGIGYFTNLERLSCSDMGITVMDLSQNTKLTTLYCDGNVLMSLDLSNNQELKFLYSSDCYIMRIDLGYKPKLKSIYLGNNMLMDIDLSQCPELTDIWVDNNLLSSLDLSNNTKLQCIGMKSNLFTELDFSYLPELSWLNCNSNLLKSLDLSANTKLVYLECNNNRITSLNVNGCTELDTIYCDSNKLTTLDVSTNTKLSNLTCKNNYLTSLDLSNTIVSSVYRPVTGNKYYITPENGEFDLNLLPAGFNKTLAFDWRGADYEDGILKNFTGIDGEEKVTYTYELGNGTYGEFTLLCGAMEAVSVELNEENFPDPNFRKFLAEHCDENGDGVISTEENMDITSLILSNQGIKDLTGIEYFPYLENLDVSSNALDTLDVSANTKLISLMCSSNALSELDISHNQKLGALYCDNNLLTDIDISANTDLKELYCDNNKISVLDITNNPALMMLYCNSNGMTELKIGDNIGLTFLMCSGNKLTTIDVSGCPFLVTLVCIKNNITSIDLSACTDITCSIADMSFLGLFDNTYDIGEVDGEFDLKNLPGNFDVSRASEWQGAECVDGVLKNFTGIDGENKITYTYDIQCEAYPAATFTLTYSLKPAEPERPVEPDEPDEPVKSETNQYAPTVMPANGISDENRAFTADGTAKGWTAIEKSVKNIKKGGTVTINLNGKETVPKQIFKAAMGKDVTLEFNSGIYTWTVYGKDITAPKNVHFCAHIYDGELGGKAISDRSYGFTAALTIDLGKKFDGKYASLFHYHTTDGDMKYMDSSIIKDGKVTFKVDRNANYVIVIGKEPVKEFPVK